MQNRWMKKSLCLACVGLSVVLTAVGTGQTAVGMGQSGAGSVLDRVQREDDPELSELIRVAVTNRKNAAKVSEQEVLELVRKVTQSYAQIKLLDQQISQVAQKIKAAAGPVEMQSELLLAKAELESKRTTELANLRETMGIVPKFPFERKPIPSLNAWLRLNVVDERVVVLDGVKGGVSGYWAMARHKAVGLLSEKETLDYVRGRLKDRKSLPIRIDINAKPAASSGAQRLRDEIIALAIETGSQMEAEVNLEVAEPFRGLGCTYYLREGKIRTLYPDPVKRPDGGEKLLDSGLVDPNDLEQGILWRITLPMNVPIGFRIEYDEASTQLAKRVADTIKAVAKRAGLTEVVEVTGALVEPVPERIFLGRWQSSIQGEMQTIDIRPGGVCQVTMGKGTQAIKAGANVFGTWLPTTNEIIIDIKDKIEGQSRRVYSGLVNADGNLVVNKGVVYYQGSFHLAGPSETIFQKVQ
jgi:TolA-binding protein